MPTADDPLDRLPTLRPEGNGDTVVLPIHPADDDLDFGPTLRGLRAGLKVFERYKLIRQLGRGGMGVVWLARDEKLDLEIALKFLPENMVHDEIALDDLRRETRRCMKLAHQHIVHVYDFVSDDTTAAIAMEFVDGKSLSALRLEQPVKVFEVEQLAPLVRQVCEALTYAHEQARLVHYDLKPGNLMLTSGGLMKVMDFGIAASINDSASRQSRAHSTAGMGTLHYMSPQQLSGYPPAVSDDIYSLGATVYELLTGRPPFHGYRDLALEEQIQHTLPPSLTQRRAELAIESTAAIPPLWEQTIAACLEKDVEKRPRSVAEVWQRLSGAPVAAAPVCQSVGVSFKAAPVTVMSSRSRKPILLGVAALLIAGSAAGWWIKVEAPKRAEAARLKQEQLQEQERVRLAEEARQKKEAEDAAEATRVAKAKADAEEQQREMAAQADAARMAQEKADAEDKKKAATDFSTGQIGDARVVEIGSGVKMTLCYIPAGSFTMGSPASEADRSDDEDQVQVQISRGFWLAKTECTQAQWREVMGTEPSSFKRDDLHDLPVENVSWEDAQAFVTKLNGKQVLPSGWQWALPSEAQWEYACRAGTTGPYAGELTKMGWFNDSSADKTHLVGTKAANAWGLQDMHGNVYEWCSDWYGKKLPGGTDPKGAVSGSDRVYRGGSWLNGGLRCRSAKRFSFDMVDMGRRGYLGFRAASVPVEP